MFKFCKTDPLGASYLKENNLVEGISVMNVYGRSLCMYMRTIIKSHLEYIGMITRRAMGLSGPNIRVPT